MRSKLKKTSKHFSITIESLAYGAIGILLGGFVMAFFAANAVNSGDGQTMRVLGMNQHIESMDRHHVEDHIEEAEQTMELKSMAGMMQTMQSSLNGKTGDDFDSAFVSEMIVHHQGAIAMAVAAKQNASHEEIKKLADDIIAAQSSEIEQMKLWQHVWGYSVSN